MVKQNTDRQGRFKGVAAIDAFVDRTQRWWPVMTTTYAVLGTIYARTSELFASFELLDALVFGGVAAIVLTAATLILFGAYRKWRTPPVSPHNRNEFLEEVVSLTDLAPYAPVIAGKTFTRCIIRGPGQIKLQTGVRHLFCSMLERHVVEAQQGTNITGAVIIVDCLFLECYFDTAIVGTPTETAELRKAIEYESRADWEQRYGTH